MKLAKVVLIIYCFLIGGVSLIDFVADPSGQPLKNGVTIVTMAITLAGIFLKKKELLFIMPAYAIFYAGFSLAKTGNIYYALGQVAGLSIPLILVYLTYKSLKNSQSTTSNAIE